MWASSDIKKILFPSGRQNDQNIEKERPEFEVKPKQLLLSGSGGISVTRHFEEAITGTLIYRFYLCVRFILHATVLSLMMG